jgi:CBS domain-containing protein
MAKAWDIMHAGVGCVREDQSLAEAARMMRDMHVGAVPICGSEDRLHGIVTDRDIVVRCIAEGADPQSTQVGALAFGTLVWIEADAEVAEALRLMEDHKIRRLPVLDERRLVGMIAEADIATHLADREIREFTSAVYSAPPNS